MPSSQLTFRQKMGVVRQKLLGALARALAGVFLLGISVLVGGATAAQSPHPPDQPWWIPDHWVAWFDNDRPYAVVALIAAVGTGGGFALSVFQVWFSRGAREATARIEALEQRLRGQVQRLQDSVDAAASDSRAGHARTQDLLEKLTADRGDKPDSLPPATPEAVAKAVEALRAIEDSPETADRRARALLEQGEKEGAFATLRAAARTAEAAGLEAKTAADADAAEKWRRLGALAYLVNAAEALEAYESAARLDPADFWTWISLARLHGFAGRTDRREAHATSALTSASDDWERSLALDEIGDVRSARNDLKGALEAYEEGLAIRRKLAASDPSHAERQRDVSVSLNKIGDVRSARNDLKGALEAYEEGLAIRRKLAASDPSHAERQRDVSVSLNKIGDVRSAKRLKGALEAYEEGLAIRRKLAASDPSHAERQRDVSVSLDRVGDVRRARNDLKGALEAYEEGLEIAPSWRRRTRAMPSGSATSRSIVAVEPEGRAERGLREEVDAWRRAAPETWRRRTRAMPRGATSVPERPKGAGGLRASIASWRRRTRAMPSGKPMSPSAWRSSARSRRRRETLPRRAGCSARRASCSSGYRASHRTIINSRRWLLGPPRRPSACARSSSPSRSAWPGRPRRRARRGPSGPGPCRWRRGLPHPIGRSGRSG